MCGWRGGILVTMDPKMSDLLDKLGVIAHGDHRLVDKAIREAGRMSPSRAADLEDVVHYIVRHRSNTMEEQ